MRSSRRYKLCNLINKGNIPLEGKLMDAVHRSVSPIYDYLCNSFVQLTSSSFIVCVHSGQKDCACALRFSNVATKCASTHTTDQVEGCRLRLDSRTFHLYQLVPVSNHMSFVAPPFVTYSNKIYFSLFLKYYI